MDNAALTMCGLPLKDNKEFPLFDYEKLLYDSLCNHMKEVSKISISGVLKPQD